MSDATSVEMYKWLGLAIVIGSAILSNLGVNIQKLSHVQEEYRPPASRRVYYTRPLWIFGISCVSLGAIGDFEALGFAPQALVASVGGGFTVLANIFFAHLWLGQNMTCLDVTGTSLIIIGVILSTVVNEPDRSMTLLELEKQFVDLGFLIYFGVMVVILFVIFGEIQSISRLPRNMAHQEQLRILPFLYAIASGIFGSFSVLLAKCASILVILTLSGENQFIYITTWLFVGGMLSTLVIQTDLLNRSIMVGDTLSVFPMFQCFWIGSSVIGGVVFYEKYVNFTMFEWICLPLGLLFIISGIYLLSKHDQEMTNLTSDGILHSSSSVTAGHFGALMPLSPAASHSHRTGSFVYATPKDTGKSAGMKSPAIPFDLYANSEREPLLTRPNGQYNV